MWNSGEERKVGGTMEEDRWVRKKACGFLDILFVIAGLAWTSLKFVRSENNRPWAFIRAGWPSGAD